MAYMITSMKGNFLYAKRTNRKLNLVELMTAQEQDENTQEQMALAAGVRAFIFAHFSADELSTFELHLQGLTLTEIVFLTDCKYTKQAHRIIQKIKEEVKAAFSS
ncbi:hypothetical protein ACFSC6_12035 [Rufibacter sediminis]|uniref:Uncharacterized protein n=1 Tax=Rufibacter sediminis TaxID=2762756 RepID=A0ABR6VTY0_9BACT|nr:hypothetical protein [Rufibacter sediminis]MBC3540611.1 hypothetical protein [Rufibacter sediminis]